MKDLEQFKLEVSDGIATVVFDRPPVNAQNRQSREEFIQLFDALSDRDDVRVVILTGTGNMFSAGADIKERVDLVHEPGDYIRNNRLVREFFYAASDCAKPVIAAINGPGSGSRSPATSCWRQTTPTRRCLRSMWDWPAARGR